MRPWEISHGLTSYPSTAAESGTLVQQADDRSSSGPLWLVPREFPPKGHLRCPSS